MSKVKVYLIAAAGTGGHVFPALAVAEKLKQEGDIFWLGTDKGIEGDLVKQKNIDFFAIPMKGFRGKSVWQKILIPWGLLNSLFRSLWLIWRNRVDVVIGFGGYVTLPCGVAAKLLGRKLVLHEQNSVAGSANRLLAKFADRVLVAYPNVLARSELVGNPVRQEVVRLYNRPKKTQGKSINLLVMGGSLGAEAINLVMPEVLLQVGEKYALNVWHQTGRGKLSKTQKAYVEKNTHKVLSEIAKLEEFLESVDEAYQWADLIVCRAGALTVSELTVVGLPAIFIPYPWAIDNHQFFNAKWVVDQSAALVVEQKNMTVASMVEALETFLSNKDLLETYANNMKKLSQTNATQKVVDVCAQLNGGESNYAA